MRYAYELARQCLPSYSCKFSRHDYTLAQLFACLVVREHQKQTFRGIEALLCDAAHWCKDLGMKRVPDHNTLWRAFHALLRRSRTRRLMDRLTRWMQLINALGRTCAVDSTLYQTHHCSRHYEHRCRQYASQGKVNPLALTPVRDPMRGIGSRCCGSRKHVFPICVRRWAMRGSTPTRTIGWRGSS